MSKNNLIDSSNILNLAKCCTRQSFYKERRVFFGILSTISAATFPSMTHDDKSISTSVVLLRFSSSSPQRNLNMGPCVWRNGEKKHWPLPQVFMWTYCIYIGTGYAGQLVPRFPLFVPFGGVITCHFGLCCQTHLLTELTRTNTAYLTISQAHQKVS